MFSKREEHFADVLHSLVREEGLETPILQRRLIALWPRVVGELVASHTDNLYIRNQTLFVHVAMPALRAELSMMRSEFVEKLNAGVGTVIISDIRFC